MKKRRIITALFFVIIVGLCGCGKKTEKSGSSAMAPKDYIYKMEEVAGFTEEQSINQIIRAGDKIYGYGYTWAEDTGNTTLLFYEVNEDCTLGEVYSIPVEENVSIDNILMDDEENIYCIMNRFQDSSENMDAETGEVTVEETEYVDEYYLTKMNLHGEIIFSVNLNDVPQLKELKEENEYFYVGNMILDKEGIYITPFGNLAEFDFEGSFVGMLESETQEFDSASFVPLKDGKMAAVMYEEDGIMIASADLKSGTMGEKYKLPGRSYDFSCYPGEGYDLYLVNSNGVYGYNLGDTDKVQLMSYVDSDLNIYSLYNVIAINEREFFAMYDGETRVPAKFMKVDPEDVKDKKQITLAMLGTDWRVRQEVVKFNKSNEDYRISIMDYAALYGSDVDYMAGLNKLNTDIVSGKMPDILLLENSMPIDSYISKGLFEDIKPYIEKDEEFNIDDFMPNVIEAFSVDGKLYSIVPSYYIQTIFAKASDVGRERGWTVQEAMNILALKPEGTQFINNMTRDYMLESCMSMAGSQFIDWEKGTCNFNSEGFIQMMEFIKSFPEEIDSEMYSDDYWNNYDSMWREGKVLASMDTISNIRNYNYQEKGTFGEKITMIGFPSANKGGTVIVPALQLTMSAKSQNKEGAWQFLRVFLTDEYQENINELPLSIKRFNKMGEEATLKPYYMDENNNKVEYDDTYYVGGIEIVIPPMTSQEVEDLKEQIYAITDVYKYDEKLLNIIREETAPFFAGQKNAKDVASIIQSRAQIYINENR